MLATGTTRFELLSVDATGPYLVGEVDELEEEQGDGAERWPPGWYGLSRLPEAARGRPGAHPRHRAGPAGRALGALLSGRGRAVLDTPAKQRLLQAPDTASRLAEELKMLRSESAVIGKLPSLPAVDLTRRPTSPQLTRMAKKPRKNSPAEPRDRRH